MTGFPIFLRINYMRKKDLKTGMVVEVRGGQEYLVMLNHCIKNRDVLICRSGLGWNSLSDLNDDLIFVDRDSKDSVWDIVKVFEPLFFSKNSSLNLIWCREETPEYTMEELIEKMGHDFKIKK